MDNIRIRYYRHQGEAVCGLLHYSMNKREGSLANNDNYIFIRSNKVCCDMRDYEYWIKRIEVKNAFCLVVMVSGIMTFDDTGTKRPFLWAYVIERGIVQQKLALKYRHYGNGFEATGFKVKWERGRGYIDTGENKRRF